MNKNVLPYLLLLAVLAKPVESLADNRINVAEILQQGRSRYADIQDYTCILHRRDLVRGDLKEHANVIFKYRKPMQFYMKWPQEKIEAIYAEGKYQNKMVIHGGLLFKFVSLAVSPDAALKYNRHTMLEADIGHILDIIDVNYRKAAADEDASIIHEGEQTLGNRKTWRFKAVFPDNRGYYGHIIFINIDKDLYLPIRIKVLGWENELLEEYFFEDLCINTGLTEDDFNVNNSQYLFKIGY
jgi:hypothetical protein